MQLAVEEAVRLVDTARRGERSVLVSPNTRFLRRVAREVQALEPAATAQLRDRDTGALCYGNETVSTTSLDVVVVASDWSMFPRI